MDRDPPQETNESVVKAMRPILILGSVCVLGILIIAGIYFLVV